MTFNRRITTRYIRHQQILADIDELAAYDDSYPRLKILTERIREYVQEQNDTINSFRVEHDVKRDGEDSAAL